MRSIFNSPVKHLLAKREREIAAVSMQGTVFTLAIENISFHQELVSHLMADYVELSSLVRIKLQQTLSHSYYPL